MTKYIRKILVDNPNPDSYREIDPHIYAIAGESVRFLIENKCNYAILISGENGSGKNKTLKHCLSFFTKLNQFNFS